MLLEGEIFPTMNVKVLAVKESCKSLVSFDYLKGGTPLCVLERLAITFPRVVKDWLMFFSYLKWS